MHPWHEAVAVEQILHRRLQRLPQGGDFDIHGHRKLLAQHTLAYCKVARRRGRRRRFAARHRAVDQQVGVAAQAFQEDGVVVGRSRRQAHVSSLSKVRSKSTSRTMRVWLP
jgi:hypothetical protein